MESRTAHCDLQNYFNKNCYESSRWEAKKKKRVVNEFSLIKLVIWDFFFGGGGKSIWKKKSIWKMRNQSENIKTVFPSVSHFSDFRLQISLLRFSKGCQPSNDSYLSNRHEHFTSHCPPNHDQPFWSWPVVSREKWALSDVQTDQTAASALSLEARSSFLFAVVQLIGGKQFVSLF